MLELGNAARRFKPVEIPLQPAGPWNLAVNIVSLAQTGKHLVRKQNIFKHIFVSRKQKMFPQQMFALR